MSDTTCPICDRDKLVTSAFCQPCYAEYFKRFPLMGQHSPVEVMHWAIARARKLERLSFTGADLPDVADDSDIEDPPPAF